MCTKIIYYSTPNGDSPFTKFLDSLEYSQQTKVLRLLLQIEEYGLISVLPHTKKLSGTPLWEIRILGKDNLRIIYVSTIRNSIVILHGFNKKTQKTPLKEIKIALDHYYKWKSNH